MGCIYGDELHFLSIFTFVCAVCLDILIKILVFQRTNKFGGLLIFVRHIDWDDCISYRFLLLFMSERKQCNCG